MKKLFPLIAILGFSVLSAQSVSDYQYVYVPKKFEEFKENQYKLNDLLISKLKAKNYTVITEELEQWPAELRQNPCKVLKANVDNTSSMLRNKLTVDFKDCNGKTVVAYEGKSQDKDYETGYKEALNLALQNVTASQPKEITTIAEVSKPEVLKTEPVKEVEQKSVVISTPSDNAKATEMNSSVQSNTSETYVNGNTNLNRIFLDNGSFILVKTGSSAPYATFKPSTKSGVYHVNLSDGTHTLGYLEGNNIVVDVREADGRYSKAIFSKK